MSYSSGKITAAYSLIITSPLNLFLYLSGIHLKLPVIILIPFSVHCLYFLIFISIFLICLSSKFIELPKFTPFLQNGCRDLFSSAKE